MEFNELVIEVIKLQSKLEVLEKENTELKGDFKELQKLLKEQFNEINEKLSEMNGLISMGKGGWKLVIAIGGVITFLTGLTKLFFTIK